MLQSDILRSARGRLVWGDRKNAKPKFTKGGRDSQGKMRGWRYEGIVRYNESVMDVIGWRKKTESTRLSYPSSQHVSYRPCFYSVPSGLKGEIFWLPAPLAVPTWMPPRFELRVSEPWGWLAHRPEALLRSKHLMTSIHFTLSSSPPCGLEQPDIGLCNWNPQKQHLYIALISNSGLKHLSPRPQGPFGWSGMISQNTNATKYLQLSHLFLWLASCYRKPDSGIMNDRALSKFSNQCFYTKVHVGFNEIMARSLFSGSVDSKELTVLPYYCSETDEVPGCKFHILVSTKVPFPFLNEHVCRLHNRYLSQWWD